MIEFRIRGAKRFAAKNRQLGVYINKKYGPEMVNFGYKYARTIAPKDTGALVRAIKKTKGKRSGKLILIQPNHAGDSNKPYHMWMHGIKAPGPNGKGYDTSKGKYRPKSGKRGPKFMEVTRLEMIDKATETFIKGFNKIY